MEKVLEIGEPLIHIAPGDDALMAVMALDNSYYPLLMEHYIDINHLFLGKLALYPFFRTKTSQFWKIFDDHMVVSHIRRDMIGDVNEFIMSSIDKGYYVLIEVDCRYNRHYKNYMGNPKAHELFIYGYDSDKKLYHSADYFDFRFYSHKMTHFDDLEQGYLSRAADNRFHMMGTVIFKLQENYEAKFDLNKVYISLKQLLNPRYFEHDCRGRYYGFLLFEEFIEVLYALIANNNPNEYRIPRFAQFMESHTYLMSRRAAFLRQTFNIDFMEEECTKLYQRAVVLRNKALRYDVILIENCKCKLNTSAKSFNRVRL